MDQRNMKKLLIISSIVSLAVGVYLIFLVMAPEVYFMLRNKEDFVPPPLEASAASLSRSIQTISLSTQIEEPLYDINNTIVINDIGVVMEIFSENSQYALEKGAWHRRSYQGNPEIGGNFIVTAHRYGFGWTPDKVAKNSGFYHINKLDIGDTITIYWNKKRYDYKIETKYSSHPNDYKIEAQTTEPLLTLYTCSLGGSSDGRVIIRARPVAI